ncbi:MAG: hypothetical protein EOO87_03185 [Pedobacter sp.]|nr:MAG: hypothetical protein EOO87_03185 [Pedobacter sp.]
MVSETINRITIPVFTGMTMRYYYRGLWHTQHFGVFLFFENQICAENKTSVAIPACGRQALYADESGCSLLSGLGGKNSANR